MKEHDAGERSAFEQRAQQVFQQSAESLSADSRSRLNRARQQALDAVQPRPWYRATVGAPLAAATACAAAMVAGWAVFLGVPVEMPGEAAPARFDDFDLLLAEEELGMLEELEFYAWLQAQPEMAASNAEDDGSG